MIDPSKIKGKLYVENMSSFKICALYNVLL
jgi:hypothetical protein